MFGLPRKHAAERSCIVLRRCRCSRILVGPLGHFLRAAADGPAEPAAVQTGAGGDGGSASARSRRRVSWRSDRPPRRGSRRLSSRRRRPRRAPSSTGRWTRCAGRRWTSAPRSCPHSRRSRSRDRRRVGQARRRRRGSASSSGRGCRCARRRRSRTHPWPQGILTPFPDLSIRYDIPKPTGPDTAPRDERRRVAVASSWPRRFRSPRAPQHETSRGGSDRASKEPAHEQTLLQTVAKLANFAHPRRRARVLPARRRLLRTSPPRALAIRQDLVTAAEMRTTATGQLAEIDRKLKSATRRARRAQAAGCAGRRGGAGTDCRRPRPRTASGCSQQTRHEIEMRLRVARRELTAHAAQLAVNVAEARIRRSITTDDQLRLVDRYTAQLREAR